MILDSRNGQILPLLQSLSTVSDYKEMVAKTCSAIEKLIDCEGVVVFESRTSNGALVAVDGNARLSEYFEEKLELMSKLVPIHPVAVANDLTGAYAHEFVVSDLITLSAFKIHPYYQQVLSGLGAEECMAGQLFQGAHRTAWVCCYRKKEPIKPREREVFRQLLSASHAAATMRHAELFERTFTQELAQGHSEGNGGPFLLFFNDWEEEPEYDGESERLLFEEIFPSVSREVVLAELQKAFSLTEKEGWDGPLRPRWVEATVVGGHEPLKVRCLARRDGTGAMLLYPSVQKPDSAKARDETNFVKNPVLTKRQNAVLYWVSEGKTNEEIAEVLSISRRTVEKHLQLAFQALGVESRLAAAIQFMRYKEK